MPFAQPQKIAIALCYGQHGTLPAHSCAKIIHRQQFPNRTLRYNTENLIESFRSYKQSMRVNRLHLREIVRRNRSISVNTTKAREKGVRLYSKLSFFQNQGDARI
jgi:hypothetical protein